MKSTSYILIQKRNQDECNFNNKKPQKYKLQSIMPFCSKKGILSRYFIQSGTWGNKEENRNDQESFLDMKYILTSREMDLKCKNNQIPYLKYCEKQIIINSIFGHLSFKLQNMESTKGD